MALIFYFVFNQRDIMLGRACYQPLAISITWMNNEEKEKIIAQTTAYFKQSAILTLLLNWIYDVHVFVWCSRSWWLVCISVACNTDVYNNANGVFQDGFSQMKNHFIFIQSSLAYVFVCIWGDVYLFSMTFLSMIVIFIQSIYY